MVTSSPNVDISPLHCCPSSILFERFPKIDCGRFALSNYLEKINQNDGMILTEWKIPKNPRKSPKIPKNHGKWATHVIWQAIARQLDCNDPTTR